MGTLAQPYRRGDGVHTIKFNVNLSRELIAKLKQYTLRAQTAQGLARNEWIEAALAHCIKTGFMPDTIDTTRDPNENSPHGGTSKETVGRSGAE